LGAGRERGPHCDLRNPGVELKKKGSVLPPVGKGDKTSFPPLGVWRRGKKGEGGEGEVAQFPPQDGAIKEKKKGGFPASSSL